MRSAKTTSKTFVLMWLVIDLAVIAFVSLQWLGWPGQNPEAEDQADAPLSGMLDEGSLQVGDRAPDFALATADGRSTVTLSSFRHRKPVVLVFGSYSCPLFRHQLRGLKQMYERYQQEAEFLVIYTQEAHAADGVALAENEYEGIRIAEHKTLDDRRQAAATCSAALDAKLPVLVDTMDNKLRADYAAWPARVYVVGEDGRIAYKGDSRPERFTLGAMVATLDREVRAAAAAEGARMRNAEAAVAGG